jgi:hypothetical protein
MLTHGRLYIAMSHVRKVEDLFFFGAETPLSTKRMYGCDVDAVEIIIKKKYVLNKIIRVLSVFSNDTKVTYAYSITNCIVFLLLILYNLR